MDSGSLMVDELAGPSKPPAISRSTYGASQVPSIEPNGYSKPATVPIAGSRPGSHSRGASPSRTGPAFPISTKKGKLIQKPNGSNQAGNIEGPLHLSTLPTGLCYDVRMRFHSELRSRKDDVHPEDPRRIYAIYEDLCDAGLVDDPETPGPLKNDLLLRIPARHATEAEICLVHTKAHYDHVASTRYMSVEELVTLQPEDSIYFNQSSWMAATLSAGGAIETARAVASDTVKNAIAVIRPPGHHAEENKAMGFCLFNNVCIAARVCQKSFKEQCRKILILDWDVHHGNGVQDVFYSDPNVLYISIHVHKNGNFYPHGDGGNKFCGAGPGTGFNVNIPWSQQAMGDGDYMLAFQQVVMPIAYEFDPDLVIVSAGFDAAAGDQLGGCFVSPAGYAHMTHMLMSLASGKVMVCLEKGGYGSGDSENGLNFQSISRSALAVTRTLMGEPPDRLTSTTASPSGIQDVEKVVTRQSRYWRSLYPSDIDMEAKNVVGGQRMHDVIRAYQSKNLYDQFKMTSLFILRDRISKSFENQVLATSKWDGCNVLIVIFHDPPEIIGVPHPKTKKLELHNTWLADPVKFYTEWAVKQGFGVIDVNIPKHITGAEDDEGYVLEGEYTRQTATEELATYLWENYLEYAEAAEMFFMGVGEASKGLWHLLETQETCYERISGSISFIEASNVRRVRSTINDSLSSWYYQNSLIFISPTHFIFDPDRKPVAKKFGHVIKSGKTSLNEMLIAHKREVEEFIKKRVS
ncbi:MAG: Histone deacetylase hda1 [Candelina mexicana]|nr:MAG: Histone deacetylase hda1 [Candelina mexicana]